MIQCNGIIVTNQGTYIDPSLAIFYLSYNDTSGIFSFPQVLDDFGSPVDQLPGIIIPDTSWNIDRNNIEEITKNFLEITYPNCEFLIIKP